jgi:Xaa-Pro aminopeptidase
VLRAGELIVIDTFPQVKDGFWGDLTRTFVKGQPTQWQREVVAAVRGAQELALGMVAPGVDGAAVHAAVAKHLTEAGFATGTDAAGNPYGFFHGTGHGVGLELHEPGPRMLSKASNKLAVGMVTSVEPGLYYANQSTCGGVGGCRIEDLGVVTADGFAVFPACPKDDWMID